MQVRKAMSLTPRRSGYRNKAMKTDISRRHRRGRLGFRSAPTSLVRLLFLLIFILGCYGLTAAQTGARRDMDRVGSIERRAFDLVNDERRTRGLQPLRWVDLAADVARRHSENMARLNFFSHYDLDGRKPSERASLMGLTDWRRIGENIAWLRGHEDPAVRVVQGWMNSPGHRENILDTRYRESGMGLAVSPEGKFYFTQLFVLLR